MCIDVAPAEGYTESHHRPAVKLARIPTAPTATALGEANRQTVIPCPDLPRSVVWAAGGKGPCTVAPAVVSTAPNAPKQAHSRRCGRCGRYIPGFCESQSSPRLRRLL